MTSVIVDTSVWVHHLRHGHARLAALLEEGSVSSHPYIIGELACGHLKRRSEILSLLKMLPSATPAEPEEVLYFIDKHRLMGVGLGYVDIHLLAASVLSHLPLWTTDKILHQAAAKLDIAFQ